MRALLILLPLLLAGCVRGRITDEGTASLSVSPLASLERVRAMEDELVKAKEEAAAANAKMYGDTAALVERSQTDLAGALTNFAAAKEAAAKEAAEQVARVEATIAEHDILDLLPESLVDWAAVLLGIGGVGAGGATIASRRRRGVTLLTGKPKAIGVTAGTSSAAKSVAAPAPVSPPSVTA